MDECTLIGGGGGESAAAPTGKWFRFVLAFGRERARDQIDSGYQGAFAGQRLSSSSSRRPLCFYFFDLKDAQTTGKRSLFALFKKINIYIKCCFHCFAFV